MQAKNAPKLHFLHRTDRLVKVLGCTVKELAAPMGVSWRTIVAGRQDDGTVSAKTWRKLEQAERQAGIAVRSGSHPLLTDTPLQEQPGDAHLNAAHREYEALFPTAAHRAWIGECRDLALLRFPHSPEDAARELDRLLAQFYAAVDEIMVCAAHGRVIDRHKAEAAAAGREFDIHSIPMFSGLIPRE